MFFNSLTSANVNSNILLVLVLPIGRARWRSRCVPIGVHGDEVPLVGVGKVWCRMMLTFQWFSLIATSTTSSTKDIMHWIWGVLDRFICAGEGGTMETFFAILEAFQACRCLVVLLESCHLCCRPDIKNTLNSQLECKEWSFRALYEGTWPSHDYRGNVWLRCTCCLRIVLVSSELFSENTNNSTSLCRKHTVILHRYARGSPESARAGQPLARGFFGLVFAFTGDLEQPVSTCSCSCFIVCIQCPTPAFTKTKEPYTLPLQTY